MAKRSNLLACVLLAIGVAYFPSTAFANTILTYTGNNFTTFHDSDFVPGKYDNTMFVSATFELLNPLPPNLKLNTHIPIVHWSISDGRNSLSDLACSEC